LLAGISGLRSFRNFVSLTLYEAPDKSGAFYFKVAAVYEIYV